MAASTTRTVKAKFDGDAKGLIAAAAEGEAVIDRFGKDTERKFKKHGDKASKSFTTSIKKWFGGAGGLKEIGDAGGTVFGSGFLGALKTPVLGPLIGTAMAAAVAVALPAVGAVAASGLVLGFGAGLAGLGIVFAAKSAAVKKRWNETLTGMGKDMTLLSKPFETTLITIAGVAERVFGTFKPSLEAVFKEMAPAVSVFADQTGKALEELQPAVRPLSEAFEAVLASLGPAMQSAVRNVSLGLQDLSASVKENPDGLADMVEGVGTLTNKLLGGLSALNDFNGKIEDLTNGTSAVDLVFGKANSKIGSFVVSITNTLNPLHAVTDLMGLFGDKATKTTGAVGLTGEANKYFTQGLTDTQAAAILAGGAVEGTGKKAEAAGVQFARQTRATDALITSLFRLQGLALGLSGAQIGYQQALDAATASIKQNGRNLDITTAKGQANKLSLNGLAQAANVQTQSMLESNMGLAAAAKAAEGSRANFVRLAMQMGATRPVAVAMAKDLIAIPNVTRTAKLKADKKDLEEKLAAAQRALKDPNLTKTREAKLKADIANAKSGIATINGMLAGLPSSKTITINTYKTTLETIKHQDVGVRAPGRASGGLMQPGRRYLLGERRSEIVEMGQNGGARVISGEQTPAELGSGGSGTVIVENHIEIGGEVVRVTRTEIAADKRNTKRKAGAR